MCHKKCFHETDASPMGFPISIGIEFELETIPSTNDCNSIKLQCDSFYWTNQIFRYYYVNMNYGGIHLIASCYYYLFFIRNTFFLNSEQNNFEIFLRIVLKRNSIEAFNLQHQIILNANTTDN